MRDEETVDIEAKLFKETDNAYGILEDAGSFDAPSVIWLPKSQTEYDGEGTFTIPEWLAVEKGLA